MKKKITTLLGMTLFAFMDISVCLAGQWVEDLDGNILYQYEDKNYVTGSWRWIDENEDGLYNCYYFDSEAHMMKAGQSPDGFMLGVDGAYMKMPEYQVGEWKPSESELYDIWNGTYNSTNSSLKFGNVSENGVHLTYIHPAETYPYQDITEEFDMSWNEGKTSVVYRDYDEYGNLIKHLEFSITPNLRIQKILEEGDLISEIQFKRVDD